MIVLLPLFLGLFSWGFGFAGIFQKQLRQRYCCCVLSFACCCGSLFCCLQFIYQWVKIEAISTILDCTNAFRLCAAVLVGGTLLLNILSFVRKA